MLISLVPAGGCICLVSFSAFLLLCCIFNVLVHCQEWALPIYQMSERDMEQKNDPVEMKWELWGAAQGGDTHQYQSIFLSQAMVNFS